MNILLNFKNLFVVSLFLIVIGFSSVDEAKIAVEVKGEVENPGVYYITEEKIVEDVLELAVLNEKSDISQINLSKKVYDEMVIIIPTKEESVLDITSYKVIENKCICPKIINDSCVSLTVLDDQIIADSKISLNTATKEELMTLPGIGEAKALLIIEYRKKKRFDSIEEIMNVKGIGKSIYEKLKDYISI